MIRPGLIIQAVIAVTGVTADRLCESYDRTKRVCMARHAGMYLCRKHAGMSHYEVAVLFGRTDHTTSINAAKKADPVLCAQIEAVLGA